MRVGILGGGQLGMMLSQSGKPLGHTVVILDPSEQACAAKFSDHIATPFDDGEGLKKLADQSDVVTYEFENLPLASVEMIAGTTDVFPSLQALKVTQDRLFEKEFCEKIGISCAPYVSVPDGSSLEEATKTVGFPCILKTRRLGYDGKGQVFLKTADDIPEAKELADKQECILEQCINFTKECSIICTRGKDGEVVTYPLTENTHQDGILRLSLAPADVNDETTKQAQDIAQKALEEFSYVGTLTVEMFILEDGSIAVNEFAPRVHNSGHWTIEGVNASQFENHMRAITGMQLIRPVIQGYCAMVNIIGEAPDLSEIEHEDGVHVHMYGKSERPGRKIGHITIVSDNAEVVKEKALSIGKLCGMNL